jgi:uncharacterized protein YbaP (TraB family)
MSRPKSLCSYFALGFAFAAAPTPGTAATSCVWRVTNTPQPCYLVGAVHSLSASDYRLPEPYYQALRDSRRLVFEMNPQLADEFGKKFARAATYPKGDDIRRHVHAKTWQILEVNFKNASLFGREIQIGDTYLPYGMIQLRPWAIADIFYGIPGYSDVHHCLGVDSYFVRHGRHSKELAGLETVDEHVAVMGGMNDEESEIMLLETIVFRDKKRLESNVTRSAWHRGDTRMIWSIEQHYRQLNPTAEAKLLDRRNLKWLPKIRAEFSSGKPVSIVVGAAHMLGKNGLVALLERNGYKLEQL